MNIIEENREIIENELLEYLSSNYNEDSIEYQQLYNDILDNLNKLSEGIECYDLNQMIYIVEEICENIDFDNISDEEKNTFYDILSDVISEHIQYLEDNVSIDEDYLEDY